MDANTLLEYALFQLTPTRTRCDLVVFCGSKKEKIASGLVEPFISHLKYAKEQIPKGGYSITLRPSTSDSSWFTKGTLERFVRFVSTPEVLERFVTIEKEITQIEDSVQSNGLLIKDATGRIEEVADDNANKSIVPYKPKVEEKGNDGAEREENSKHRLHRVLETRKAFLRKEQAMAYYRAYVAGYEMECIDDLISFADAFGASRLRDACMNFKELCYKKHNDGLWMDELAAMEACAQPELPYLGTSGIILTTENNNSGQGIMQNFQNGTLPNGPLEFNGSGDAPVSESAASHASSDINQGQMPPTTSQPLFPMSWPNQHPQFMYNFPNHQMPPYQGFPFPGMQIPPQYQGNMQWPPSRETYGDSIRETSHRRKSSSRKKVKSPNEKESQISEQEENTESSSSTSEGDLDAYLQQDKKHSSTEKQHKRSGKKSSRMVVIRNINYITSKRNDGEKNGESDDSSLDEDEVIDGEVLKRSVEDAVGSLEKHKSTTHHSKKKSGNKTLNTSNGSINALNHDENDSLEEAKTNENWGAFQDLLLREDDSMSNVVDTHQTLVRDEYFTIQSSESGLPLPTRHSDEFESEQGTKLRMTATDLVVLSGRDNGNEGGTHSGNFEEGKDSCLIKKKRDYTDEELLFSGKNDDAESNKRDTFFEGTTESSVLKIRRGEDWFIVNQDENSARADATKKSSIFDADEALALGGSNLYSEKSNRNALVDDSFMIQDRSLADDQSDSQWRTDISLVSGLTAVPQHESNIPDPGRDKSLMSSYEPDDLYMMLDRNSGVGPAAGWATEVDYSMDLSLTEVAKQNTSVDVTDCIADTLVDGTISDSKTNGNSAKKQAGSDTRSKPLRGSLGKSRTEIISRSKKPSTISRVPMHKTKFETEEETRKRMEELLIERQKRIAERSAARGLTPAAVKKAPVETKKTTIVKSLNKPGITSSTVNRLTSSTGPLKSAKSMKTSTKENGEIVANLSSKNTKDENKKSKLNPAKSSRHSNGTHSPLSDVIDKDQSNGSESKPKIQLRVPQEVQPLVDTHISADKELHGPSSTVSHFVQTSSADIDTMVDKRCNDTVGIKESSLPLAKHSAKLGSTQPENERVYIASPLLQDYEKVGHGLQDGRVAIESPLDTPQAEVRHDLESSFVENGTADRVLTSTEISEEATPDWVESTPPSATEYSLDQSHSRKKWTSDEPSPPSTKGFKKLLLFGRKKGQVAA